MTIHHVESGVCCALPDPRCNILLILLIQWFEGYIRILSELFQEEPFPLLRFTLQLKAAFAFLPFLSLPISVIKPAVISISLSLYTGIPSSPFHLCAWWRFWNERIVFDIFGEIDYNILNRLAEGWVHFTRPGESINSYIKSKPFPNLPEYRTAYFLFFRFRIATTSDANVSKIMNSSYVLIKYHTFLQTRERVGARPSASRVSILCCQCAFVLQDELIWPWLVFVLWYELCRRKWLRAKWRPVTEPKWVWLPPIGVAYAADRAEGNLPCRGCRLLGRILIVWI